MLKDPHLKGEAEGEGEEREAATPLPVARPGSEGHEHRLILQLPAAAALLPGHTCTCVKAAGQSMLAMCA